MLISFTQNYVAWRIVFQQKSNEEQRCYSHYSSHHGRFQNHFKPIHSTVDFTVFLQRSFTTTRNTQRSFQKQLTYKVFIPLCSFYINTGTFKKIFPEKKQHETPSQMAIYVGAINIINCYNITWKRGTIFWPSLFCKFAFVLWNFKQIPRRTGKQRLDLRIHATIMYFDNRHFWTYVGCRNRLF